MCPFATCRGSTGRGPTGLPDDWSAVLHAAVQAHGVEVVWTVGLEILGYPPMWAETAGEVAPLLAALTR